MSNLLKLLIRRKITAIFANGTSQQNLGVLSVVGHLDKAGNVPVELGQDEGAHALLTELAKAAGRTIDRASAGNLYLTTPLRDARRDSRRPGLHPSAGNVDRTSLLSFPCIRRAVVDNSCSRAGGDSPRRAAT